MRLVAVFFCLSAVLAFGTMIQAEQHEGLGMESELQKAYPIVRCSFIPTLYEKMLMTQLRDVRTTTDIFRNTTKKLGSILVTKAIECLRTKKVQIQTPVSSYLGEELDTTIDLVSILRSGDALLSSFISHFPSARISKILIQRDEVTARPCFKYMKLSPTITTGSTIVILDPMLATGGTLEMAIDKLKEMGVEEEKIVVVCVVVAPEGLARLSQKFPRLNLVFSAFDEKLNEKKYIVPGLGDFGDRYFNPE